MIRVVLCSGACAAAVLMWSFSLHAGEWDNAFKEDFLLNATAVKAKRAGKGVTETWQVTLKSATLSHDASFQYVDEREAVKDMGDGTKELNFVDSYRYNIAAYRLAMLLGLDDLVPVSVERDWRGNRGAMTWWIDDVMMDEAELNERGVTPPDESMWIRQIYRVRVFNELVYDTDRNQGNMLITNDWHVWMIDFSRAFRRWKKLRQPEQLMRCDRALFRTLAELERSSLDAALGDILDDGEIEGVWARRGLIVEHFRTLMDERGEDEVLFELATAR